MSILLSVLFWIWVALSLLAVALFFLTWSVVPIGLIMATYVADWWDRIRSELFDDKE